jgi:transposase
MAILSLSDTEREALQNALKRERDALVVKRAQALLWLSQGEAAMAVAQRVGVTRQTIYNWLRTFQARAAATLGDRLRDSARSGRPPTKREAIKALIARLWEQPSDTTSAPSDVPRTAAAIQRYLAKQQVQVHERTIRRTLRALNYRYKRPRYVLARRSKTWRQQKGG